MRAYSLQGSCAGPLEPARPERHVHLNVLLLLLLLLLLPLKCPGEDLRARAVVELVHVDVHDVQTSVDVTVPKHAETFAALTAPHSMDRSAFLVEHRLQPRWWQELQSFQV